METTMKQTGGDALAGQLVKEGVRDLFGIPGVQLDWATEGLRKVADDLRYVVGRHEQTTSYMADGYARTTGQVGVCMVVPGPGLLNAMAGLSTAYACNSRVLCISGDIHSSAVGKGIGLLHEIRNQSETLGTVTKWTGRADRPEQIPGVVRDAFKQLNSGRPQPVGIEIPHDVLATTADIELIDPSNEDGRQKPDTAAIEKAAERIAKSKFPVIYVGGGVLAARATDALIAFAEKLQAPVVMGENGRGAISDRHPLALNSLQGRAVFPHADLVIVVGSRFVETNMGKPAWSSDGTAYIYLNVDEAAWEAPRRADVGIVADCKLGLEALKAAVPDRPTTTVPLAAVRDWALEQMKEIEPQGAWVRALRAAIPDDGILVNELTQVGYFARLAYPVYQPGTFINPGYQGTLGYGFPTALGVAAGNPHRAVVSINGDGGFGWGMSELATARKYNLNIAIIVFNDGNFGNVKKLQDDQFGKAFGVELFNPSFEKLAEAFEIPYRRVDDPTALAPVLKDSFGNGPIFIEARVGPMPSPWHLLRLVPPPFAKAKATLPNPLGEPGVRNV
jgi:acetolactate synthase-1/2/3 large subunit